MEFSLELAEICGIHAGDGYLRNDGKRRELDISGGFEEYDYYDNVVKDLFKRAFNIDISPKFFLSRRTYGFVIRKREIIEFMNSLGFPYGNKTYTVSVPNFIKISNNNELKCSFLRGLFSTDGCLSFRKCYGKGYSVFKQIRHHYPLISFKLSSKFLAEDIYTMLLQLGFTPFTRVDKRKPPRSISYEVILNGVPQLQKWMNLIGINNPSKLTRYEIWKKYGFCPTNLSYVQRQGILKEELDPFNIGP